MNGLVKCITDNVKPYNNDNMGMKSADLCFNDFPLFLTGFFNIHEYANYTNKMVCIFDHEVRSLCVRFTLVPILYLTGFQRLDPLQLAKISSSMHQ